MRMKVRMRTKMKEELIMAYMPLNKNELYLETEKMPKIWDLSQPWAGNTPLWPFPAPVLT